VLILIDDMGYRDPGFVGNRYIDTPNIDRIARSGVTFSQCYASAPNCAPTRACLLTGQYPSRHGVYTVVDDRYAPGQPHMRVMSTKGNDELPAGTRTVADVLKSQGYATALIGMWNLGRGRNGSTGSPTGRGFDIYKRPDDVNFAKDAYRDEKRCATRPCPGSTSIRPSRSSSTTPSIRCMSRSTRSRSCWPNTRRRRRRA
jgi:arylsulfatase A-like enzyme